MPESVGREEKRAKGEALNVPTFRGREPRKESVTRKVRHMLNLDEHYPSSMQSITLLGCYGAIDWLYTAGNFLMDSINGSNV